MLFITLSRRFRQKSKKKTLFAVFPRQFYGYVSPHRTFTAMETTSYEQQTILLTFCKEGCHCDRSRYVVVATMYAVQMKILHNLAGYNAANIHLREQTQTSDRVSCYASQVSVHNSRTQLTNFACVGEELLLRWKQINATIMCM
jgi:hypothetical protein